MLALTLRHPWPFAVCQLGKRIENRLWLPGDQLPVGTWFAIHGGKPPESKAGRLRVLAEVEDVLKRLRPHLTPQVYDAAKAATLEQVLACSGIVAVCRYGGHVTASDSPWFEGPYGLLLDEVFVLPKPVPCKGAQKLWEVPEDVLVEVRRLYKEAKR